MSEIMQKNCDNVAVNNTYILTGTSIISALIGGVTYYKKSKTKKAKVLKSVGIGILSSFITGAAVSNLYLANLQRSKECLPYWTQLPEQKGTLVNVETSDY